MAEKIIGRCGEAKLCYKNIAWVKVLTRNNIPYKWLVKLSGCYDMSFREYFMGNGLCSMDSSAMYRFSDLPTCVKAFIHKHKVELFGENECHNEWYRTYIYR